MRGGNAMPRPHFYITTNGTLIDDGDRRLLRAASSFNVYFSIDGDKEEPRPVCANITMGGGSFDDVMGNFRLLRARPHVHIIGSSVVRDGFSLGEAIDLSGPAWRRHLQGRARPPKSDEAPPEP